MISLYTTRGGVVRYKGTDGNLDIVNPCTFQVVSALFISALCSNR